MASAAPGEPLLLAATADGEARLWSLRSRVCLAAYKEAALVPRALALVAGRLGLAGARAPDYFLGAAAGRPAVHAWAWGRDAPLFRCALPEPLGALAVSPDGLLAAGGGASGRAYVWDVATGELLRAWNSHYKAVSALAWSPCGGFLASGGCDGVLHVWDAGALVDVADAGDVSRPPAPHVSWSHHALPITSLSWGGCGGLGLASRLVSGSADRSARVWDAASGRCLLKATALAPVTRALLDAQGGRLLMACGDGCVYEVDAHVGAVVAAGGASSGGGGGAALGRPPPPMFGAATAGGDGGLGLLGSGSLGGGAGDGSGLLLGGLGDGGGPGVSAAASARQCYVGGHAGGVVDMVLTSDGTTLVTGGEDGVLRVWDCGSKQQTGVLEGGGKAGGAGGGVCGLLLLEGAVPPLAGGAVKPSQLLVGLGPLAPLRKHAIPPGPDWRGSTTGPLDVEATLRLAPAVGGGGGGGDAPGLDAAFQLAIARLLLPAAAGGGGGGGAPVAGAAVAAAASAAAPAPAAAVAAAGGGEGGEVAALQARVEALEAENARWRVISNKLNARLQAGGR